MTIRNYILNRRLRARPAKPSQSLKACPICQGTLELNKDGYGAYLRCMNCGRYWDLPQEPVQISDFTKVSTEDRRYQGCVECGKTHGRFYKSGTQCAMCYRKEHELLRSLFTATPLGAPIRVPRDAQA